ncbi:hypothetical protein ACTPEO_17770 [Clostridioides difficile]
MLQINKCIKFNFLLKPFRNEYKITKDNKATVYGMNNMIDVKI